MTPTDALRKNFVEVFNLPQNAVDWLCQFYDVLQFFDDVVDNDPILRGRFDNALWNSLVGLQINPFYSSYALHLLPIISQLILKWQASDNLERQDLVDEKTYMWRAGYYDLVLTVVQLVHGHQSAVAYAPLVLQLYGESYQDYKEEFELCQIQSQD